MNKIFKTADQININDVQAGVQFIGGDGVLYTITERKTVQWDDAPLQVTYLTVTDGENNYVVELNDIVKVAA